MAQQYTPLLHQPPFDVRDSQEPAPTSRLRQLLHDLHPGFTKRYNVWLFSLSGFAVSFFCLARLKYLSTAILAVELTPGDWFWFHAGTLHVGFMLHLACMLPVGLLMIPQFVPRIRRRFIFFHRVNGYTIIALSLGGNVGALLIARRAFGGDLAAQSVTGLLVIMSTFGLGLAWYNIRRLQIDQHRAWMLRSAFWICSIVTTRLIMPFAALIMTARGGYYTAWPCEEIEFVLGGRSRMLEEFPQCATKGGTTEGWVAVKGVLDFGKPTGVGAVFDMTFGMGLWLALFLHGIGVEIYLALTPVEAERLRRVSYEKQLQAGFKNPGSAGTTVQKWGDALEWPAP